MICHADADDCRHLSLDKEEGESYEAELTQTFGSNVKAADYALITENWEYDEEEDPEETKEGIETAQDVKDATAAAYNTVGETAHLGGNLKKAERVMTALGYSPE